MLLTSSIDTAKLMAGIPALTPEIGAFMAQACAVCLDDQAHSSGVELMVLQEDSRRTFALLWENDVTDDTRRAWGDLEFTTEQAAYGIAILLVIELTEFTAIERSRKGPGFDYWLGKKNQDVDALPFEDKARLEVSGIRKGDEKAVKARVKRKVKQTNPSDDYNIPAIIVVVEFGRPLSYLVRK